MDDPTHMPQAQLSPTFFEGAPVAIAVIALDGAWRHVNHALAAMLGYGVEELAATSYVTLTHPDDHAATAEAMRRLGTGESPIGQSETRLRTKDGSYMWLGLTAKLQGVAGASQQFTAYFFDISQHKAAAAALHLRECALASVAEGIVIADAEQPDFPVVYAGPGFTRLTGYGPEAILGSDCRGLRGLTSEEGAMEKLRLAIDRHQSCTLELANSRNDGRAFWNDVRLSPVKDASGRVTHMVVVQTDVTDRHQLDDLLRRAQKLEAVGLLARGVAHDLNNALSVILGYAGLVSEELKPDEPLWADVEEIRKGGLRAADLTQQLLAFSRKHVRASEVLVLNERLVGMEKLISRVLGADIALVMLPAVDLGGVEADPAQIEPLVLNLAVNARDAMPNGGTLTIETANVVLGEDYARFHPDVKPGSYVMLAVTDSGAGMDEETLSRVFELSSAAREQGQGTPLVLVVVAGIVKQNGGHILAVSEPGIGTTFKIYFPVV